MQRFLKGSGCISIIWQRKKSPGSFNRKTQVAKVTQYVRLRVGTVKRSARITQGEGRLEGVEGRRGRGGWRVRRTYRGLAPCWTCFLHFHLLPPSFYKPPSSNLSSFDTTKHAMRDTRKQAFVVYDTCVQ